MKEAWPASVTEGSGPNAASGMDYNPADLSEASTCEQFKKTVPHAKQTCNSGEDLCSPSPSARKALRRSLAIFNQSISRHLLHSCGK